MEPVFEGSNIGASSMGDCFCGCGCACDESGFWTEDNKMTYLWGWNGISIRDWMPI